MAARCRWRIWDAERPGSSIEERRGALPQHDSEGATFSNFGGQGPFQRQTPAVAAGPDRARFLTALMSGKLLPPASFADSLACAMVGEGKVTAGPAT
jgi:hypothetical protein